MNLHDLKDIVDIYYSDGKGGISYDWDKTPIVVWNPDEQRKMNLVFTGSTRPGAESENDPGQINFNATYLDDIGENCVLSAFDDVLGNIIDSRFDMAVDWKKEFLKSIIEKRNQNKEK